MKLPASDLIIPQLTQNHREFRYAQYPPSSSPILTLSGMLREGIIKSCREDTDDEVRAVLILALESGVLGHPITTQQQDQYVMEQPKRKKNSSSRKTRRISL